jgi:hypothetical protein
VRISGINSYCVIGTCVPYINFSLHNCYIVTGTCVPYINCSLHNSYCVAGTCIPYIVVTVLLVLVFLT